MKTVYLCCPPEMKMLLVILEKVNKHFISVMFVLCSSQVRYLKIIEKSGYQALPWVRYITQNGGRFNSTNSTL